MGRGQRADGVTHIESAACAAQLRSYLCHVGLELCGEVDVDHADLGAKPAHDRRHRALSDQPQTIPQRGHDDAGDTLVVRAQREPPGLREQELIEVEDDAGDTPTRNG